MPFLKSLVINKPGRKQNFNAGLLSVQIVLYFILFFLSLVSTFVIYSVEFSLLVMIKCKYSWKRELFVWSGVCLVKAQKYLKHKKNGLD